MSLGGNAFSAIDLGSENDYEGSEQSKTLLTIRGDSAKIEGKLIISKSIEIDCEVHGELVIDGQMKIQQSGYVNADVKTIDAIVTGVYEGNMEATGTVQITESGKVNGNIKTDSLIIEKGGIFSGNVVRISTNGEKKNELKETHESSTDYSDNIGEETAESEYEAQEEKEEDTLEL
ncbi:MAG TPA: polymer-forming cytoskeletal protein [Actinobacteria bacterium]|jgi:cytoskeletal protein CcmA (bactofilin family)|nr:polymer-forming cytoskeletal protein [Actinomycetota bacterium]